MPGSDSKRRRATTRITDKMETVETVAISLPQNPLHLSVEAVVRRRLIPGVHLEILRNRSHALAQHLKQRRIRRLSRQHRPRQQHSGIPGRHPSTLLPDMTGLNDRPTRDRYIAAGLADPAIRSPARACSAGGTAGRPSIAPARATKKGRLAAPRFVRLARATSPSRTPRPSATRTRSRRRFRHRPPTRRGRAR